MNDNHRIPNERDAFELFMGSIPNIFLGQTDFFPSKNVLSSCKK